MMDLLWMLGGFAFGYWLCRQHDKEASLTRIENYANYVKEDDR